MTAMEAERLLLILGRVAGIFMSAPVLSSTRIPVQMKVGLAVMVALILRPVVGGLETGLPGAVLPFAALAVRETLIGVTIGFIASLIFSAVQMAGELGDMQAGFAFAGMLDPRTGERTSVIGQVHMLMAWLIFLGVNGHHVLLNGVAESFRAMPLGAAAAKAGLVDGLMVLASRVFAVALQIGAPVVGAVLLADLALGMLSRTVPQMNVFVVGFPIKMVLGLTVLMLALPLTCVLERNLVYLMREGISHLLLAAGR